MTDLFTGLDKKRSPGRESPPRLLQVHDLQERMVLADKLQEANRQLVQAFNQNEKLVNAPYEAREQFTPFKEKCDKPCPRPSPYAESLPPNEQAPANIPSQA